MAKKKTTQKPTRQLTRRQLSQHQKQRRRQRFVFIGGIAIVAVIILLVVAGWFAGEYLPLKETVIEVDQYKYKMEYYIDFVEYLSSGRNASVIPEQANSAVTKIENNAILFLGAGELGINVSDDEVRAELEKSDIEISDVIIDTTRAQILTRRLRDEHFENEVPLSADQVNINAMMLESESQVAEVTERLQSSDNFSALVDEYSVHSISRYHEGEFGWHTREIHEDVFSSSVPVDFAFNAEVGALSPALYDKINSKQVGYWLINVEERLTEEEAVVRAVLLGSEDEARDIRARIDTSDNVSALIAENSQHISSGSAGGEMGPVQKGRMSETFDEYVFSDAAKIGVWSEPIRDETMQTKGGYWLVQVLDKEENRPISDDDRTRLMYAAYSDWLSSLQQKWASHIDHTKLTLEKIQWVIEKVTDTLY